MAAFRLVGELCRIDPFRVSAGMAVVFTADLRAEEW